MTNWKIGMKAVCVDVARIDGGPGANPPLKLDAVYTVKQVETCPQCSGVLLDIGLLDPHPASSLRCVCGYVLLVGDRWPVAAKRFRPLLGQEQSQLDEIEQSVVKQLELA